MDYPGLLSCQLWTSQHLGLPAQRFLSRGRSTTWTEFCHFLTPPPPLCGQFLYPERGQKQRLFDLLPPHLVHVVIEWPPRTKADGMDMEEHPLIKN